MAENRLDEDEIVDSIMGVAVQLGLVVERIRVEEEKVNIHVAGAERMISLPRSGFFEQTLEELRSAMKEQLHE